MIIETFEARAERDVPRGAEAIWGAAARQSESSSDVAQTGPAAQWFRLALAAVLIAAFAGVVAVIGVGVDRGLVYDAGVRNDEKSTEPRPQPIVVEGMRLDEAFIPWDSDLAQSGGVRRFPGPDFVTGETNDDVTQVFADLSEPFTNPILFVTHLEGGGFRPWGVNLQDQPVTSLSDQLIRSNGVWTMTPESGLVEVASLGGDRFGQLHAGWQLSFRRGADGVTWQAEPHDGEGIWRWLRRISEGTGDNNATASVKEIDVLGQPGLVVDTLRSDENEVIWVDGEFVYRLLAFEAIGDMSHSRLAADAVDSLQIIEADVWESLVVGATRQSRLEAGSSLVSILAVFGLALSAAYCMFRRRFGLAIFAGAVDLVWFTVSDNRPLWAALPVLGLVTIWWLYRRSDTTVGGLFSGGLS